MTKSCIYCKEQIDDSSVIDFCKRCGIGVWGEPMLKAIIESMEKARDKGDLFQGSVTDPNVKTTGRNSMINSNQPRRL